MPERTGVNRSCKVCGSSFYVPGWRIKDAGRGIYCSLTCTNQDRVGRHYSPRTELKPGNRPWNAGIKSWQTDEKHPMWRGDSAKYSAIHMWIKRKLGKAIECRDCGQTNGKIHWANISLQYLRDRADWIPLCAPCHGIFDSGERRGAIKKRFGVSRAR